MALVAVSISISAQTIRGKVLDENAEPLEFATVALRSLPDSSVVAGSVTETDGSFVLTANDNEAKSSNRFIQVSMIGYRTEDVPVASIRDELIVRMVPDSRMLDEAVVSAVLPKTELKGNAVVTNIAGSVLEHSGNALDVLGKIPGMINKGGSLEVIGRGAPLYYINGRKITDNSELRNLMSEDIKSIDVVSNPGAAYGGEVRCVVRIKTVKHQGEGFSFALTSQAKQHLYKCKDFEPSWTVLDLNYRYKGWDFFGKLVYWNQRGYQISDIYGGTIVRDGNDILYNYQQGILDYRSHRAGFQYMGGANWQINDNHSLGFRLQGAQNTLDGDNLWMDEDVLVNGDIIDHLYSVNKAHGTKNSQWDGNFYYDGQVEKLHINFNADFVTADVGTDKDVYETSWEAPVELKSTTDAKTFMAAGKFVLSYPIWKGTLQGGVEETYVSGEQSYSITHASIPASDASLWENTIAGFLEYGFALPFGQVSAGLRYEHADFNYKDKLSSENDLKRVHNNWFPSFSFSAKAGPVNLGLSYSGKTIRPRFGSLSSEITYDNRFTYQMGDPLMKNEIQRTLSFNANWKWLTFSSNYERVDNSFYQKAFPYNDEGVVMIQESNCDDPVRKLSMYLNASPTIKIWYPRITVGMEKQFFHTVVLDPREATGKREISLNSPMYLFQFNNTLRFKHNWTIDADYQFISPFDELVASIVKPLQKADIAVSKSFLKNEALNIRLSWEDIFNSYVPMYSTDYGNCQIKQSNDGYRSCVLLRVSYRFNSAQNKYKGTGAGESAKNRL